MHVTAVLHAYPPTHGAGAEWMAHSLFRALVAAGHSVDVVLSRDDQVNAPYELDGVRVHPYRHKSTPVAFVRTADVVVTHLENTPRASVLARMYGKPSVHLLHNTFDPTRNWIRIGRPALLVYNSAWMQADYRRWLARERHPEPRSVIVHPPVYADDYLTTPGDHVTLVNMTEQKGAKVLYALAERLPDVRFLAVEGGYGEQIVRDLPNVTWQPNTANMRDDVYARTRVLLAPSEYESWGRVAVEAMVSGIPVIAHPTPGLLESLEDAGIFADRDDLDAWHDALVRLLDGRRWRGASRRAKQRADELDPAPDLERFVTELETLPRRHR